MNTILIDSNVIMDVFEDDPNWGDWSEAMLDQYAETHTLCINSVIYAEVSIGFEYPEEVEAAFKGGGFEMKEIPRAALFRAGKAFLEYRRRGGTRTLPLPDFFIGAHAEIVGMPLMTRDSQRFKTYFPQVHVISPDV